MRRRSRELSIQMVTQILKCERAEGEAESLNLLILWICICISAITFRDFNLREY